MADDSESGPDFKPETLAAPALGWDEPAFQGIVPPVYPSTTYARRPAAERGVAVLADRRRAGPITDREREVMFGATRYQR